MSKVVETESVDPCLFHGLHKGRSKTMCDNHVAFGAGEDIIARQVTYLAFLLKKSPDRFVERHGSSMAVLGLVKGSDASSEVNVLSLET